MHSNSSSISSHNYIHSPSISVPIRLRHSSLHPEQTIHFSFLIPLRLVGPEHLLFKKYGSLDRRYTDHLHRCILLLFIYCMYTKYVNLIIVNSGTCFSAILQLNWTVSLCYEWMSFWCRRLVIFVCGGDCDGWYFCVCNSTRETGFTTSGRSNCGNGGNGYVSRDLVQIDLISQLRNK